MLSQKSSISPPYLQSRVHRNFLRKLREKASEFYSLHIPSVFLWNRKGGLQNDISAVSDRLLQISFLLLSSPYRFPILHTAVPSLQAARSYLPSHTLVSIRCASGYSPVC